MSSRLLTFASSVAACIALVSGLVSTGCSSSTDRSPGEKDSVDSYESELRLAGPRYVGQIANGETKTNYYYNPPKYRAFGFTAKGGEQITVDVKSAEGDAMGWITTTSYDALAANDDASSSTLDAKVTYKVPAGTASKAYRIVFRDYDLLDATFTVKLTIDSTVIACTYEGQTYQPGDNFPASDECNTCTCSGNGSVGCSKKACVCDPENEPWRNYVGTPATCQTIRYTCATDKRQFQNACGCGCEALSH